MAQTLTAQRFGQLLRTDLLFIINYIVGNNPSAVSDKLAVVVSNRPATAKDIGEGLNYLLNAGRGNDFVEALNVPLNVSELTPDQTVQMYAAAGGDVDSTTAAKGLATNALALFNAIPAEEVVNTKRVDVPAAAPEPTAKPCTTCMDADKKKTVMRIVWIGLAVIGFVVVTAIAVRTLKKAA